MKNFALRLLTWSSLLVLVAGIAALIAGFWTYFSAAEAMDQGAVNAANVLLQAGQVAATVGGVGVFLALAVWAILAGFAKTPGQQLEEAITDLEGTGEPAAGIEVFETDGRA